ncbi:MAG: restriction endonuclease subunit S, partial [Methanobrevibacter sp.]|nr:restriction endonuclease subunit S [Methanobrevibacter sp.]
TRGSLTTKIIKELDINLPNLQTQNKIAEFIKMFDRKIELCKLQNKNFTEINLSLIYECIIGIFLFIIKKYFILTDFEVSYIKLICMKDLSFDLTNLIGQSLLKNFYFQRDLLVKLIFKIVLMLI